MEKIYVLGDTDDHIIDIIEVDFIPNIIGWRGTMYTVWCEELNWGKHPAPGKNVRDYKGRYFFYYDD